MKYIEFSASIDFSDKLPILIEETIKSSPALALGRKGQTWVVDVNVLKQSGVYHTNRDMKTPFAIIQPNLCRNLKIFEKKK